MQLFLDILITKQLLYFAESILIGFLLCFIFDIFKILRLTIKHCYTLIFLEDLIFFIISAIITYSFMVNVSFGQIRFFIITGELIGFVLFRFLISKFIIAIFLFIINTLKKIIKFIFKIFFVPVYKIIYKFLHYIFKAIFNTLITKNKILKKLLKNILDLVYNFYKAIFNRNFNLKMYILKLLKNTK